MSSSFARNAALRGWSLVHPDRAVVVASRAAVARYMASLFVFFGGFHGSCFLFAGFGKRVPVAGTKGLADGAAARSGSGKSGVMRELCRRGWDICRPTPVIFDENGRFFDRPGLFVVATMPFDEPRCRPRETASHLLTGESDLRQRRRHLRHPGSQFSPSRTHPIHPERHSIGARGQSIDLGRQSFDAKGRSARLRRHPPSPEAIRSFAGHNRDRMDAIEPLRLRADSSPAATPAVQSVRTSARSKWPKEAQEIGRQMNLSRRL